jgi:hypothetical protein
MRKISSTKKSTLAESRCPSLLLRERRPLQMGRRDRKLLSTG